ncbi:MAG: hypothetical protein K0V04_17170 [Deltaproteobacteria bacterium]|nr:hypothetical protein [Deltaproteobacteria bacterium]
MALGVGLTIGCAPRAQRGGCNEDQPCETRGEVCDLDVSECVAANLDVDAAETPAPGMFTDKTIAFHRGEICLPLEVQSGTALPVLMRPCLHPCVTVSQFEFRHLFECLGSRCDALALAWMVASSADGGCPADAFDSFDSSQCVYGGTDIEFQMATETSNGPISGTMLLEVPFLTNEDITAIAGNPGDTAAIDERVHQYPQQQNRIPDGQSVSILASHPAPPVSCADGACPCYPIGF